MKTNLKQHPAQSPGKCDRGGDSAISPVVGVMLMLVVTIIIAAVVSGFAGGLIGTGNQKTPTLNMDVSITNSGTWRGSGFSATVTGMSEPIPTKNLKLVTSWTTTVKTNTYAGGQYADPPFKESTGSGCILSQPLGTVYHGGAEVIPGVYNTRTARTYGGAGGVAPFGSGSGVEGSVPIVERNSYAETAYFGNFILNQGTVMTAAPIGGCLAGQPPYTGGIPEVNGWGTTEDSYGGYGITGFHKVNGKWENVALLYQYNNDGGGTGWVYQVYTGTKTTPSEIIADGGQVDNMQAVLGCGWENLRAGDTVNVKLIYTPTGKTIFDKDVVVTA